MLAISHDTFKTRTARWFPRYRSKRMDAVLTALERYEADQTANKLDTLRQAMVTWKATDPKEWANRDQLSNGLCVQLWKELGIAHDGVIVRDLLAYEITGVSRANSNQRPTTTFTSTNTSVTDHMGTLNAGRTAVMLIDMQSQGGDPTLADPSSTGGMANYNHRSVHDNQISVIEAADELGIVLFNVTTGVGKQTLTSLSDHFSGNSQLVVNYRKVSNNAMDATGIQGSTLLELLEEKLGQQAPRNIVVMGFDANQCVKGTIFGSLGVPNLHMAYKPGLLDLGFTVITSRTILASSHRPLEEEYGPLMNM